MERLKNRTYELVENKDGHVSGNTIMQFGASIGPLQASYTGPNVVLGHAIVAGDRMLYHALDSEGNLSAGEAKVVVSESEGQPAEMVLHWQWLTGEKTSGISVWRQTELGNPA